MIRGVTRALWMVGEATGESEEKFVAVCHEFLG